MKIALYVGDHRKDSLRARLGWAFIRFAQKGPLDKVTHCEAILDEHGDGTVTIASSSLRDGGVRVKHSRLDPQSWRIADTHWSTQQARQWFTANADAGYDLRGALATVLPGKQQGHRFFCNEAVGAAVGLVTPEAFHPAQFAAICFTFGREVTHNFFAERLCAKLLLR